MTWTVLDVMTKNVTTADQPQPTGTVMTTGETDLAVAASLMFQHHAAALPVVDSQRRLVGTVTRSQVLKAFLRSDRSIRREIIKLVTEPAATRGGAVDIKVVHGLVQLRGEIESGAKAKRLIRLIRGVPGVVGVESRLITPATRPTT